MKHAQNILISALQGQSATIVDGASATAPSAGSAAQDKVKRPRARRGAPRPFKYRNGWRAQFTPTDGQRVTRDFKSAREADDWLAEMRVAAKHAHAAKLGGPTQARLADVLEHYARTKTVMKKGFEQELGRINQYLDAAELPTLRGERTPEGKFHLREEGLRATPSGWQAWLDTRRAARSATSAARAALAVKPASRIGRADIECLMQTMDSDGLSASTIQKEIALIKSAFNTAVESWNWLDFKNPCLGVRLGKSNERFVLLSQDEWARLNAAVAQCDNPYFRALVEAAIFTTARKSSLLKLRWEDISFEDRVVQLRDTKSGHPVYVPMHPRVLEALQTLPRDKSGKVFPMSDNAVDCAWEGVREKAGLPKMWFADLRHVGATYYARGGMNAAGLQRILGHRTPMMATRYINLVGADLHRMMLEAERNAPTPPPSPATGAAAQAPRGANRHRWPAPCFTTDNVVEFPESACQPARRRA